MPLGASSPVNHKMQNIVTTDPVPPTRLIESPQGAWLSIGGQRVLNLCSNNYLGLANDPRLIAAAQSAMDKFGVGPAAVRPIAGTTSLHAELERRLTLFKRSEATVTLPSGFMANLAAISALVGVGDVIFSDRLNHASIIDGCRLSGAKIVIYDHLSILSLQAAIETERLTGYRQALIVTDGVFSMDGDLAPLPELLNIARRARARLMVDDAHGEGVLGKNGRGIVNYYGLDGQVDLEIGTMSKAFGVIGGFITGKQELIRQIRQQGRPYLFSSAMTIPDTAACLAALEIMEKSSDLIDRLWANARYFQAKIRQLGFEIGQTQTPITPIIIGQVEQAERFSQYLLNKNVFATAIGWPMVPRAKARIRVMISSLHSRPDLDYALKAFSEAGQDLK